MPDDLEKKLEMQVVEVENTLRELIRTGRVSGVTSADLETYLRVKAIVECQASFCSLCIVLITARGAGRKGGGASGFGSVG